MGEDIYDLMDYIPSIFTLHVLNVAHVTAEVPSPKCFQTPIPKVADAFERVLMYKEFIRYFGNQHMMNTFHRMLVGLQVPPYVKRQLWDEFHAAL